MTCTRSRLCECQPEVYFVFSETTPCPKLALRQFRKWKGCWSSAPPNQNQMMQLRARRKTHLLCSGVSLGQKVGLGAPVTLRDLVSLGYAPNSSAGSSFLHFLPVSFADPARMELLSTTFRGRRHQRQS